MYKITPTNNRGFLFSKNKNIKAKNNMKRYQSHILPQLFSQSSIT